jgi:formylglycine-generating enzyme required for sulfatase activity
MSILMRKILPVIIVIFLLIAPAILSGCGGRKEPGPAKPSPSLSPMPSPAPADGPSPWKEGSARVNPVDGAELVHVPAGEFLQGGNDSTPPRTVSLGGYYIYRHEVTNRQFKKFVEATGYHAEGNWERWTDGSTLDYPVVMVSWNDADAYCRWAGVKLPTEAQWEKAARGTDGRVYPWGSRWDPSYCNNRLTPEKARGGKTRFLFEKTGTLPGGSFPRDLSPFGVYDMAGNVSEWTRDVLTGEEEGDGEPGGVKDRILKGGSFYGKVEHCRAYERHDNSPDAADTDYGFRPVWEPGMPCPSPGGSPQKSPAATPAPVLPAGKPISLEPGRPPPPALKNPADGAEMILIPGGPFTMGASPGDPDALPEEKPARQVHLGPYYIYRHEVTYGQFARFAQAAKYRAEGPWQKHYRPELANHPVAYITWNDAAAYCRWAGGDLPTEAQWEKAARGREGFVYSWGNHWDPDRANVLETKDPAKLKMRHIYYDGLGTAPVGAFPGDMSPYGLMDVTGNVIEWCRDWFDPGYYGHGPGKDPQGPPGGTQKVMRGGGWGQDRRICRSTYRDRERPGDVDGDFGFRCVVEPRFAKEGDEGP